MTGNTERDKPGIWRVIRNRIVAGLFVALPVFITYLVLDWIYRVLIHTVISPIAEQFIRIWFPTETPLPFWLEFVLAPAVGFLIVLGLLFVAGMFFQSRVHRFVDWILLKAPGVNMVYSAVKNVVDAIQQTQNLSERFRRVVLVEFPHPGIKVPAFVTSECRDTTSGQTILSCYVPTTPVPTSGYMLLVPEKEVIPLDWELQETLQAIVSGGITIPNDVRYYRTTKLES